ncbi:hypothetical protein HY484_03530, partial [Candidatus Woesearchaeota archaeon]|nr:hypothetical protein [Candidatus Woesearchaeota archaeon]
MTLLIILQFLPNAGFLPWGGMNLRLQSDDILLSEKAANDIVYDSFYRKFYTALTKQQPNLPEQTKEEIIRKNLDTIFDTDPLILNEKAKISAAVKNEYQYITNGRKYTYLHDIDTYYYLRRADNVLKRGHAGDTIKNGIPWDNHATAPMGSNVSIELHPYTIAYLHRTLSIFNPATTLMQSAGYFPIITTILTLITLFFIGKSLSNNLGGLVTATLFSLNYAVFTKTAWGMADTDAYNILFPTALIYFFLKAFTNQQKKLLSIIISGIILGLYAFTWAGWWYTAYIVVATILISLITHIISKNQENVNKTKIVFTHLTILLIFILFSSFILTYVLSYKQYAEFDFGKGFTSLKDQIKGPFSFSKIDTATRLDLWPNVYTTVAELQAPNINKIIDFSGGTIFLILAVIGIFLLIKNNKPTNTQFFYGIFLTLTILAGLYASLKGQRFILLLIAPLTIATGHTIMWAYAHLTYNTTSKIRHTFGIIFLLIILITLTNGQQEKIQTWLENEVPKMNDAWWNALTQIKEKSDKNAIITSWWDFGHQFSYIADRAVTFDGASQNTPMAHWVGKALSTNNEQEAIGILRMLACGSNKAYDVLIEKHNYNLFEAHDLLNNLFLINKKDEAQKYLSKQQINNPEEVLQYTHCNPPENYFITSEDMSKKAGVWSHFGNWDFKKAYLWNVLKNKPIEEAVQILTTNLSYNEQEARELYEKVNILLYEDEATYWIGPPWTYSTARACEQKGEQLTCGGFLAFNTETKETIIKHANGETKPANSVAFVDDKTEKFTVKTNEDAETALSAIIFQDGTGTYYGIGASKELTNSMFTRLMYFDAHGLTHFKPFA